MDKLESILARADALLEGLNPRLVEPARSAAVRWRTDAAAARFHLRQREPEGPLLLAVIGGTGTGKSTIVNRLLNAEITATSFRRTFTSGAVAVARRPQDVPDGWLGVEHVAAGPEDLPARGRSGALVVAIQENQIRSHIALVDTPDLDGDQPAHHAEADRAFRWADAVLFLVTPEKYQMTELLPYYRLAARYAVPSLYAMNKCEGPQALDDYQRQLEQWVREAKPNDESGSSRAAASAEGRLPTGALVPVYSIPRDDAAYDPPASQNLESLRTALASLKLANAESRQRGLRARGADLLGRLSDQIAAPLRAQETRIKQTVAALRGMETPSTGVDVNPLTQQLQRRLQQRSVLYLMGPQRILDRVRQAPGLLVRLPRAAWEYMRTGEIDPATLNPGSDAGPRELPDFAAILGDQFAILQSRIDDVVRGVQGGAMPLFDEAGYAQVRIAPEAAGKIAQEELADLRVWLEKRWNATPRDTRMLQALLKYLPGGKKLTQWTEAAPYLLTLIVLTHQAFFGHIDLLVFGGYSLATWLSERLSNEVAAHTRTANRRIEDRFSRLAHEQIERVCEWLQRQVPSAAQLQKLDNMLAEWEE